MKRKPPLRTWKIDMGRNSKIEWCTATWSPWYGCHKVSPACDRCYAETWAKRSGRDFSVVTKSKTQFNAPEKWKDPERIFVCSLSDFWHPHADEWRIDAFRIMARAPQHRYMLLTKRIERVKPSAWLQLIRPLVWLGVTVEAQKYAGQRIPLLFQQDCQAKRFLSCEPLLGPLDLSLWLDVEPKLDWVIVGGESGPDFREIKEEWATDIRDQCAEHGVPFFFKQWSGLHPKKDPRGVMLDGREWKQTA